MAPIRIGFVGLSKKGWGKLAHWPYLSKTSNYKIVAICNSSKASSEAIIKELELPASTKAYGSPEELANDADVDLAVVSVKVPHPSAVLKPLLEAGKDIYVEWPLAFNLTEAEELAQLAKAKGVKSVVGAQGAMEPVVRTVKQLIDSGAIGRVVSSEATLVATAPAGVGRTYGVPYLLSKESFGVLAAVYYPHCESLRYSGLGRC
jgi:predicted dehydrogenase